MRSRLNSIAWRITGLMSLAITLTVFLLLYLANLQMARMSGGLFTDLTSGFMSSGHESLLWVGLIILFAGCAASWLLARSIIAPLNRLSNAAAKIARGDYNQRLPAESASEIGELATLFNRMAESLATSASLRQQLLANVAHELKTPLAVIQGHLEGMLDDIIPLDKETIASLHEEAVRLNRLIKDLRDLSLAEVRQLELTMRPTDINSLLTRTVLLLKPLADARQIALGCELSAGLPEILLDTDRTNQVFYNIITNALRYTQRGGVVKIVTSLQQTGGEKWLSVSVSDNGSGIAAEDLPYVFDHFYRGDKSRDRKSGGSGLGLAIARQLVEIHGGQISVESQPGSGSVFRVLFPLKI